MHTHRKDNLKKVNNDVTAVLVTPILAIVLADNSSVPWNKRRSDCLQWRYAALSDRRYSSTGRDYSVLRIWRSIYRLTNVPVITPPLTAGTSQAKPY